MGTWTQAGGSDFEGDIDQKLRVRGAAALICPVWMKGGTWGEVFLAGDGDAAGDFFSGVKSLLFAFKLFALGFSTFLVGVLVGDQCLRESKALRSSSLSPSSMSTVWKREAHINISFF